MSGSFDPRWGDDPRDRYDDDRRDRDEDDGRSAPGDHDPRQRGDRYEHELERDHGWDTRDRVPDDPRDVLLNGLDLPRGLERQVVWDREQTYELNGDDSRSLATVGAFRVVPTATCSTHDPIASTTCAMKASSRPYRSTSVTAVSC